ncbi:MAG: ATP-binding protein [Candidatus Roizmanbacteria bacterium]|nr:ATP-binding protein [Candidatus Roizmanbacteria bacterium]
MLVTRTIAYQLKKYSKQFPILSVTGPRQSGKTTLIRSVFDDYTYANLEDPQTREFARSDPKNFIAQSQKMIIDEAQHIPELFSYVQVSVDNDRNKKIILTGSQNFLLSKHIGQSLAGRVAVFTLLPFSFIELRKKKYSVEEMIFTGGYPRIYENNIDPTIFHANYTQTYLERDVEQLLDIKNKDAFLHFIKSVASNVGGLVNYSSLAAKVGIAPNTAKEWIGILKASYIVYTLTPYYRNINKQVSKSSKLYFYDTGLLSYLLGIKSSQEIPHHYLYGALFENFLISECVKHDKNYYEQKDLYFLRDSIGNEVDLFYSFQGKHYFIEIKSTHTFHPVDAKGLRYFSELLDLSHSEKYILYRGKETQRQKDFTLMNWEDFISSQT